MPNEKLNIDRAMVTLFFEIKRNLPYEDRDEMKISSPDIGTQLVELYKSSGDTLLERLIRDFMLRAGDDWPAKLEAKKKNKRIVTPQAISSRHDIQTK